AEYRLLLRQDNADARLSKIGFDVSLLPERHYRRFKAKEESIDIELQRLATTRSGSHTLAQILRRPEVSYKELVGHNGTLSPEVVEQIEVSIKYAGYLARQETEIGRFKSLEHKQIPIAFDYATVPSLRNEARQKLSKIRPATLGQASRI